MGISRLVLGAQCVAAGLVEEVKGFNRFEGDLFQGGSVRLLLGIKRNLKTGVAEDITNKV
jgi:hypothetical protein